MNTVKNKYAVTHLTVWAFAIVALLAVQMVCQAQAPAAPKVEVRGIRIVGDSYGDGENEMRPFNWSKGTTLVLLVTKPDAGIIALDSDQSKLLKFADDKGTNLTAASRRGMRNNPFGPFSHISADGKACMIELDGGTVPATGATTISASGTISLQCGSKKDTAKQDNVALKPNTKVAAGPFQFQITKTGKPEMMFGFGDNADNKDAWQVTLSAKQDLSNIMEIKFLDAAGKEIKTTDGGTSSMNFGNSITVEKAYILPKKADSATITVTYWADMKEVTVPFDVKATLGLDESAGGQPDAKMRDGIATDPRLAAKMSEGIAGAGSIRSAFRVYAAGHAGNYPTLTGAKANALSVLGIAKTDLDGRYFKAADYEVTSTATTYTIKATLGNETYIIDQDGVEIGTYKTGE